ncbi:MAG: DUF4124 domain-containing protein [Marinobacter sp.]|uniref:DUF4124 domain-containing protein n=1 Tax=Marinobacter sp. TaxID=50741 RepID=UPI00299F4A98|nr:DUF4124 domain-containing protein [Marinobacter sp.]MDX1756787.1 DUF4124 domain-containing protein [Marinobacter sp.]
MTLRFGVLASLLAFATAPATAEIYRQVDAQGNVTYSDEPSSGAETVEVQPTTTITLPKLEDVTTPGGQTRPPEAESDSYSQIRFEAPANNAAFHSGSGDVEFRVSSAPALKQGHLYEITLDGQPVGQSHSGSVMVRNVFRGTHTAQVHIIDENGVRVKTGDSVTFTVHRPSVLN